MGLTLRISILLIIFSSPLFAQSDIDADFPMLGKPTVRGMKFVHETQIGYVVYSKPDDYWRYLEWGANIEMMVATTNSQQSNYWELVGLLGGYESKYGDAHEKRTTFNPLTYGMTTTTYTWYGKNVTLEYQCQTYSDQCDVIIVTATSLKHKQYQFTKSTSHD